MYAKNVVNGSVIRETSDFQKKSFSNPIVRFHRDYAGIFHASPPDHQGEIRESSGPRFQFYSLKAGMIREAIEHGGTLTFSGFKRDNLMPLNGYALADAGSYQYPVKEVSITADADEEKYFFEVKGTLGAPRPVANPPPISVYYTKFIINFSIKHGQLIDLGAGTDGINALKNIRIMKDGKIREIKNEE